MKTKPAQQEWLQVDANENNVLTRHARKLLLAQWKRLGKRPSKVACSVVSLGATTRNRAYVLYWGNIAASLGSSSGAARASLRRILG